MTLKALKAHKAQGASSLDRLVQEVAELRAVVARMNGRPPTDRLLTVEEAAQRLAVTPRWLYRHAEDLPFTVRLGRLLRFSERRIDSHLQSN